MSTHRGVRKTGVMNLNGEKNNNMQCMQCSITPKSNKTNQNFRQAKE